MRNIKGKLAIFFGFSFLKIALNLRIYSSLSPTSASTSEHSTIELFPPLALNIYDGEGQTDVFVPPKNSIVWDRRNDGGDDKAQSVEGNSLPRQ